MRSEAEGKKGKMRKEKLVWGGGDRRAKSEGRGAVGKARLKR